MAFVNFLLVVVVLITSIIVASFCVYVFRIISHGQRRKQNSLLGVVDLRYTVFFFHAIPAILLIFCVSLL